MPSPMPMMVSVQVPYTDNEQQFLAHVVQAALRQFRSMNPQAIVAVKTSPIEPPLFTSSPEQLQPVIKES
jgi:hypothetical protein